MKNTIKLGVFAVLAALGVTQVQAQDLVTNTVVTTNVILTANFALTGYVQTSDTGVTRGTINSKSILKVITNDLASGDSPVFFSRRATLVAVSTPDSTNAPLTFAISDGTNLVDVSSFLTVTATATPVTATKTSSNGRVATTSYTIEAFHLGTSAATFDVAGFATVVSSSFIVKGMNFGIQPSSLTATVSGAGSLTNDFPMVNTGKVTLSSRRALASTTTTITAP